MPPKVKEVGSLLSKIITKGKTLLNKKEYGKKLTEAVSRNKALPGKVIKNVQTKVSNINNGNMFTGVGTRLQQTTLLKPRGKSKRSILGWMGKSAGFMATPVTSSTKAMLKRPMAMGGVGVGLGVMSGTAQSLFAADERTSSMNPNKKGMPANHLGTDGLTNSLSRTRHRR